MPITPERGPHFCDMGVDWNADAQRAAKARYPYTSGQAFLYFKDLIKPHTKVLEVGCQIASWIWAWWQTEPTVKYEGLDWSEIALKIANERYGPNGLNLNCGNHTPAKFYHMDARDMNFTEAYDIIFTHTFFQHTNIETKDIVVPKMHQALKKNGLLIMQENTSYDSLGTWLKPGWIKYFTERGFDLVREQELNGGGTGFVFRKRDS
jgi:ubiquinone/menaquinone biosynthesis C-methylase UbiE